MKVCERVLFLRGFNKTLFITDLDHDGTVEVFWREIVPNQKSGTKIEVRIANVEELTDNDLIPPSVRELYREIYDAGGLWRELSAYEFNYLWEYVNRIGRDW